MEPTKPILVAPSPPLVGWVDLWPPLGLCLYFRSDDMMFAMILENVVWLFDIKL